jgi:preprotein translocase subunit YajC
VTLLEGLTSVGNWLIIAQTEMLAQADGAAAAPAAGGAGAAPLADGAAGKAGDVNPMLQFLPMIVIFAFFYFILMRPQQKEARKRQELLSSLKKNDKVVTAGGLIGTVADISPDGQRVTLKVDDNTRIKFLRSSIQSIYEEKSETEPSKS